MALKIKILNLQLYIYISVCLYAIIMTGLDDLLGSALDLYVLLIIIYFTFLTIFFSSWYSEKQRSSIFLQNFPLWVSFKTDISALNQL